MDTYHVAVASSVHELAAKVTGRMNEGWKCQGGVSANPQTGSLYQAMVKVVEKDTGYFGPG